MRFLYCVTYEENKTNNDQMLSNRERGIHFATCRSTGGNFTFKFTVFKK